jgi:hypothetical protein
MFHTQTPELLPTVLFQVVLECDQKHCGLPITMHVVAGGDSSNAALGKLAYDDATPKPTCGRGHPPSPTGHVQEIRIFHPPEDGEEDRYLM